jgi:hypothetical protein
MTVDEFVYSGLGNAALHDFVPWAEIGEVAVIAATSEFCLDLANARESVYDTGIVGETATHIVAIVWAESW